MTLILSGTNGVSDIDGDASTPAVRGTDANSGIFFGADTVGVSTNGVERVEFGNSATVFNDGGADVDFRVEGDTDANLLFVDASADAIGIGTSSSTNKATIQVSNTSTSPNSESGLSIFNSARGNNYQASVKFGSYESNNTTRWTAGEIGAAFTAYTDGANSGDLLFSTSNAGTVAERLRITSAGNVGIGVTPSAWTSTFKALQVKQGSISADNSSNTTFANNCYFDGSNWKYINSAAAQQYLQFSGQHIWTTAASGTAGNNISFTSAMTLDASGKLLLAKTGTSFTVGDGYVFGEDGQAGVTSGYTTNAASTWRVYSTGAGAYRFFVGYDGVVNATNATISAISDQRLKENIRDLDVGLAEIMQLQPRVFDWKEGKGKDIQNDRGFIAQEFEQVFPNLIDEWIDPAPEGEEPYKSVRQDLIPVLVKAIQELKAELDTVKAELATLKG